ncbi:MAG: aromatic aminobenezylarsenical efflux permease ArsG family transporter [Candidatus Hydrogenedentes bacterium]|nr:aromatic aminobenezylarsenical efflux permease ArsG family transporter [Candidatus Hydrogenedentota bacterium]
MTEFMVAMGGAFWLGFLTSISPCLLATNVTAITFISRRLDQPRLVAASGGCYMVGQAIGFVLLAVLVTSSLTSIPVVSHWLQKYLFRLLGPILVVVGLFLLELLDLHLGSGRLKGWAQRFGRSGTLWATMLLGLLFAMSFCPTTAALFFGGLIPLSLTHESHVLLPLVYAVGVSVPVLGIVLLVLFASHLIGRGVKQIGNLECWMRRATGGLFLLVGLYFTVVYTLGLV